jgi:hypothetical protein
VNAARKSACATARYRAVVKCEEGKEMKIDAEIRHVTKPGSNLFLDLGFTPDEAKTSTGCVPQTD